MTAENKIPHIVFPPGETLKDELDARGWTQKEFAEIIGKPVQAVSEIVNGKKEITPETALLFSRAFGTSARFWLNLESSYRLWLENKNKKVRPVEKRAKLFEFAPVSELRKYGWIPDTREVDTLENSILKLLGIKSLDEIPKCALCTRRSEFRNPEITPLVFWMKRVEKLIENQTPGRYTKSGLLNDLPELLALAGSVSDVAKVPKFLLNHGIHFALAPHLQRTYLDGAQFWFRNKPVIALTLRHDRIDSFWFTLMHEIAHLVSGHRETRIDRNILEKTGNQESDEINANRLASDWLIEPGLYLSFVESNRPNFRRRMIESFANEIKRHPGIVLGRLQFDGEVPHSSLRKLLERVRPELNEFFDIPVAA